MDCPPSQRGAGLCWIAELYYCKSALRQIENGWERYSSFNTMSMDKPAASSNAAASGFAPPKPFSAMT